MLHADILQLILEGAQEVCKSLELTYIQVNRHPVLFDLFVCYAPCVPWLQVAQIVPAQHMEPQMAYAPSPDADADAASLVTDGVSQTLLRQILECPDILIGTSPHMLHTESFGVH